MCSKTKLNKKLLQDLNKKLSEHRIRSPIMNLDSKHPLARCAPDKKLNKKQELNKELNMKLCRKLNKKPNKELNQELNKKLIRKLIKVVI